MFLQHHHLLSVHTWSGSIGVVIGGSRACGGGPTALPGPLEIITGVLYISTVSPVLKRTQSRGGNAWRKYHTQNQVFFQWVLQYFDSMAFNLSIFSFIKDKTMVRQHFHSKKNSRKNKSGYQNRTPWTLRCHLEQCLPCSWSLWPPQTRSGRRLSSVHPLRQSTTDCCGSQSDSTLEGWGNPRPSCKRSGYVRMYRTCGTRNSDTWWCLRWWVDWLFLPCRWHVEGTRSLCRCSSRFLWCGHWKVQCWWCQCLLVLWSNQTDHPLPVSRYTVQTQSYSPTGMELKQLQKSLKNALFSGEIVSRMWNKIPVSHSRLKNKGAWK